MIIIGCDYHPGFQQIAFVIRIQERYESRDWSTERKRKGFIAISERREQWFVWGWKRVGTLAGLSECSRRCDLNCGSGMRRRFARSEYANRRRIARMRG
jgi:hypothetical protein